LVLTLRVHFVHEVPYDQVHGASNNDQAARVAATMRRDQSGASEVVF
jgi:hypothetical protein